MSYLLIPLVYLFTFSVAASFFNVDLNQPSHEWNHYWEECVGSGHAVLALREDWRNAMRIVRHDLGFKQVRFHGLFNDDMSVVFRSPSGSLQYSFYNIDNVFDFLLSIGMKPLIELSFMPEVLALNTSDTIMHYKGITSPPKDYNEWVEFMTVFAGHLINRYGINEIAQWSFEVWNEPNCGFFSGSKTEYYKLLKITSDTLHKVDSRLRVGGPATCQAAWVEETMDYINNGTLHLDFISTHLYPTDVSPFNKDIMYDTLKQTNQQVKGQLPIYYTEYNDGLFSDPSYHDTPYASGFIVKTITTCYGLVDALSWWTFSDVFEEQGQNSTLFGNSLGWGLLSLYDIPKPSFRAFQLLHQTGNRRYDVTGSHPTVGVLATRNNTHLNIIAWNHIMKNFSIRTESIVLTIKGTGRTSNTTQILGRRVDQYHSNPNSVWIGMGSPKYPTKKQLEVLHQASKLIFENIAYSIVNQDMILSLTLLPDAVISIDIKL